MAEARAEGWIRRLWRYMLRHRRSVVISLVAALLGSLCQVFVPLVARQIVDGVIVEKTSPLAPWLVLLLALAAATFGFTYLRRYRGGRVALEVQNDLRNDMHDHLQRMDAASLDRMPTGQLVSRANSDSALVQGLLNMLPIMSGNVILMVLSIVVMFTLAPVLALVSLVMVPALVVTAYRMRAKIMPATWDAQQREGEVAQIVDEDVGGVRVVKAFGREQHEVRKMARVASGVYGSQMRSVRIQSRFQPLLESIPTLAQVAILALGGWLALHGDITIGTFLAFTSYVASLMAPARQLAGVLTIGQQAQVGIERIFQLIDREPTITDAPDAVALDEVRGEIVFEYVTFGYGTRSAPALDGLDIRIRAGERVALVGPSGSGKSTVASLIARFHDPESGRVLLDGHDLRDLTLHSLRGGIGMVFEESFLFSDTVGANIAYGRPDATDAAIRAAASVAHATGFIDALPKGFDTVVGERGLSLSGGQRQRIALARAILSDQRILILDDATSAIDASTEQSIHDALRGTLEGRTVLLVAHRESTLHLADRIVVLDHGRAVDEGTHDELVASSALYRALITGMGEDDSDDTRTAAAAGDVDTLSRLAAAGDAPAAGSVPGTTESAWGNDPAGGRGGRSGAPVGGLGMGLGGGGGRGGGRGMAAMFAATPELLARVEALGPIRDVPAIDIDTEAAQQRHFSLRSLLREFRKPLLLALVFVVIDAVAGLIGPYLVKTGIDRGVQQGSEIVLFTAAGLFLVVTLADLADGMAETFVTGRVAQRIMLGLRIRIFAQLQRLSLDFYEREMAGRVMTRMTTDVDQFESLIQNGLLSALVSIVTFVGVGVALVLIDTELGLLTLSVVVPLVAATVWFRSRSSRLYDEARERIAIVNADFQESLSGVRESQAFVHETVTMSHFHGLGRRYLDSRIAAQRLVATYFPFVQFLSGVADVIVLGVGASLIASGHLTSGALIAFLLYIDMFFSPIQQLSQVFDSWQQTRVSVSRISDLMRLETLTPDAPAPVEPGRLRGAVELRGVRFAYPAVPTVRPVRRGPAETRSIVVAPAAPTKPPEALHDIALSIAPGETIALVGETGAGKSTVMKLVARFYDPDGGAVLVDGVDLRTFDLLSFRRQLGYVPQEAFLFTGTVRDNIAFGRPDATDAEVESAARAVGAHEFVSELAGGYHHLLAERGRSLSAGHRQLIALARAELVDPAVLLLDEATSNLDLLTEARVTAAMQRVAAGRTTIVIAHRLQTARAADRVGVLAGGRVAELGTHDELVAAGGRYAAMWRAYEAVDAR